MYIRTPVVFYYHPCLDLNYSYTLTMNTKQFYLKTLQDELPRFERVLQALPNKKLGYRPHPRSKSAGEVASMFANESGNWIILLKTGEIDFTKVKPKRKNYLSSTSGVKDLRLNSKKVLALVKKLSEKKWETKAQMKMNGKVEWEAPLGVMLWVLLLDLIHHRGQLSVYLRPMGGKVPSIYGPSGDSNG